MKALRAHLVALAAPLLASTACVTSDLASDQPSGDVAEDSQALLCSGGDIPEKYYRDFDGDGHAVSTPTLFCSDPGPGWSDVAGSDCNDHDASVHPGAVEIANDGKDSNCDGVERSACKSVQVDSGKFFSCALSAAGNVKCWGNNEFGQLGLGDAAAYRGYKAGEMGDNLPIVNLGTGKTAKAISTGANHACAILNDDTVKCWGGNDYSGYGALGLGDTVNRGDNPGEMGNSLPTVNLGTGKTAKAIAAGIDHTCAILNDNTVKCWGPNANGQLGLGDTADRGDNPGEMGDSLPTVNLGTGKTAKAITAGYAYTCAILNDDTVKCWGDNYVGQLGLGDTADRGDAPGEMGDSLPAVQLGSGLTAVKISAGFEHVCALLTGNKVKCWGHNGSGALGVPWGPVYYRGAAPGEMGDSMPVVDLDFTPTGISSGAWFNCAFSGNSLKCWGSNGEAMSVGTGDLGLGDRLDRGDDAGEMGSALPFVNLGCPGL